MAAMNLPVLQEKKPTDPSSGEAVYGWIQLTNRCNLSCAYCYTESGPAADGGDLPYEVARQAVADLHRAGGRSVMLSGGEPTTYPHLLELLDYACGELGLQATLVSNGTLIRPQLLDKLTHYGCTVQISLDAVHESGYQEARGNPRLPQALQGIEKLRAAGVEVTLSTALTTVNQGWVGKIVEFAIDNGIQFVHFAPTHWKDGGSIRRNLFIEDLYPVLRELYEIQKANYLLVCIDLIEHLVVPVALGIQRKFYCNAMAGRTVEVSADGAVYACAAQRDVPEMKLGDISGNRSLFQIIQDKRQDNGFPSLGADSIEECLACEYRYICAGGCRANTYHQMGGLHQKHPNCADLKRIIGDIKSDMASGEIADYVDFLTQQMQIENNPDGLLKVF